MDSTRIEGHVDNQHRLSAMVPGTIPPGPVTVWIAPPVAEEDDAGQSWMMGIAHEWEDELRDARQDIYNLADGESVDPQ